jgi:hypothetical protein
MKREVKLEFDDTGWLEVLICNIGMVIDYAAVL